MRDIQARLARGNSLITKLRALKLHFELRNEPVGKVADTLRDFYTAQRLHLENLERVRSALEKARDRTLTPAQISSRRERRKTSDYGFKASQSIGRRPN